MNNDGGQSDYRYRNWDSLSSSVLILVQAHKSMAYWMARCNVYVVSSHFDTKIYLRVHETGWAGRVCGAWRPRTLKIRKFTAGNKMLILLLVRG